MGPIVLRKLDCRIVGVLRFQAVERGRAAGCLSGSSCCCSKVRRAWARRPHPSARGRRVQIGDGLSAGPPKVRLMAAPRTTCSERIVGSGFDGAQAP